MSGGKKKNQFAAIPIAAIGDKRLHAADFRVLSAIAGYDRFTNNGRGCFAKQERLATETGLQKRQLTRSLKRLEDFGYIRRKRAAKDRRRRTYFVNYNDISVPGDSDVAHETESDDDGKFDEPIQDTDVPFRTDIEDMGSEQLSETIDILSDNRFSKTGSNKFRKTGGFAAESDSQELKEVCVETLSHQVETNGNVSPSDRKRALIALIDNDRQR